jgi:hypothetical protein
VSGKAKLVYIALSSRANAAMECRPSLETIAAESSMSTASAKRALGELRELGYVSWYQQVDPATKTRGSNVYRLYPDASGAAAQDEPRGAAAQSRSSKPQLKAAAHRELQTIQGNDSREREQGNDASERASAQTLSIFPDEPTYHYTTPVRLPEDFHLTSAMIATAREKGWSQEFVAWSTERFKDWANGTAGANGRKLDWIATWRKWLSGDEVEWHRLQRARAPRQGQQSKVEQGLELAKRLRAEEEAARRNPNGGYNSLGRELEQ